MQEVEEWSEIPGAAGYKISNFGNVIGMLGGKYKTPVNHKGYPMIRIPARKFCQSLHKVVADLFIGPRPEGMQINHIDGNKLNSRWDNLEYISCKDNINHAINLGLRERKANLKTGMFDKTQLAVIRHCFAAGFGNQEISRHFRCHHSTISKIRTGIHYPL